MFEFKEGKSLTGITRRSFFSGLAETGAVRSNGFSKPRSGKVKAREVNWW
jgi:hypothetical protein